MTSRLEILVTNDDGIHSEGIIVLAKALHEIGEIFVVAPDRVFVWDLDNTVRGFDLEGKPVWEAKAPAKITSPICLSKIVRG
jgi:hypothetical protein